MPSDSRPAKGSVSATELARMGACETQIVLDARHGRGPVSAKAKASSARGIEVHERALQAAIAANGAGDRRCFIATAVYGGDAWQTDALRGWRDRRLAVSTPGRAVIALYYRLSPVAAAAAARWPWLRRMVRVVLDRLVRRIAR